MAVIECSCLSRFAPKHLIVAIGIERRVNVHEVNAIIRQLLECSRLSPQNTTRVSTSADGLPAGLMAARFSFISDRNFSLLRGKPSETGSLNVKRENGTIRSQTANTRQPGLPSLVFQCEVSHSAAGGNCSIQGRFRLVTPEMITQFSAGHAFRVSAQHFQDGIG